MSAAGISLREFARRDGCDDKLVRRALKEGHLTALPDGRLDPALVGSGWRRRNRRAADTGADSAADTADSPHQVRTRGAPVSAAAAPAEDFEPQPHGGALRRVRRESDEAMDEAAERMLVEAGEVLTIAEAERLKEIYLARLRKLEYDTKSGLVVLVAEVAGEVARVFATVRTRLLAIPAEQAPRLHRCGSVLELRDALAELMGEALEELSRDGALRPGA